MDTHAAGGRAGMRTKKRARTKASKPAGTKGGSHGAGTSSSVDGDSDTKKRGRRRSSSGGTGGGREPPPQPWGHHNPNAKLVADLGQEQYWEVEDIVGRRLHQGQVEYRVRWKNCPPDDDTWEPSTNLCDTAMDAAQAYDRRERNTRQGLESKEKKNGKASAVRGGVVGDAKADRPVEIDDGDDLLVPTGMPVRTARRPSLTFSSSSLSSSTVNGKRRGTVSSASNGYTSDPPAANGAAPLIGREKRDRDWTEMFERLKEYKARNGTTWVVSSVDRALYNWTQNQRNKYHACDAYGLSSMRPERIALLDSIGFSWMGARDKRDKCPSRNALVKLERPSRKATGSVRANDTPSPDGVCPFAPSSSPSLSTAGEPLPLAIRLPPPPRRSGGSGVTAPILIPTPHCDGIGPFTLEESLTANNELNHNVADRRGRPDPLRFGDDASSARYAGGGWEDAHQPWQWNDAEQVYFQPVERVSIAPLRNGQIDIPRLNRIRAARQNGIPLVLTGHKGWAQFASLWLSSSREEEDAKLECEGIETDAEEEQLLDLSDPTLKLDVESMIQDIGDEQVPIVRRNYNAEDPISTTMKVSKFLSQAWLPSEGPSSTSYLHQWQFPLSPTAGYRLCHQSRRTSALGDDLLSYWLDLPQCLGDSPFQYLFMGREDTSSKLHRDNGGMDISIAPIIGRKECTLVHRDDATCLYHLRASLDKPDLHRFPLLAHARVWRTVVEPGEILLMPEGTFHQCRNVTKCLSYHRFHLDEVNLPAFVKSLFDHDAPELSHDEILWNAATALIRRVDGLFDEAKEAVRVGQPVRTLNRDETVSVRTLRCLRNVVREVGRRLKYHHEIKGVATGSVGTGTASWNPSSPAANLQQEEDTGQQRRSYGTIEEWEQLLNDIDVSLHDFRHRRMPILPPFRPRSLKSELDSRIQDSSDVDEEVVRSERARRTVAFDTSFERAYLSLPEVISTEGSGSSQPKLPPLPSISDIRPGDVVLVRLLRKRVNAKVLELVQKMVAALVTYDEYPAVYNEYQPICNLRSVSDRAEISEQMVIPGLPVFGRCMSENEEYRGIVQRKTTETMLRVKYLGMGSSIERWVAASDVLGKKEHEDEDVHGNAPVNFSSSVHISVNSPSFSHPTK